MNIVITGGGTGGHLAIAKALKEELNKRGIKPIFIGSSMGQDKDWFENDVGFEKSYFLNSRGVVNKKGLKKFLVLWDIFKATLTCKNIFKTHKVEAVFCVGGYSAAPASFASILGLKPLYIHEQNAVIGTLNKLLKPFAKDFFSSYENTSHVKDYPVAESFFKTQRIRTELKTIIFLGGSQGAGFINNLAKNSAQSLIKQGLHVIHQTGKSEYQEIKKFYEAHNLHVDCFDFSKDLVTKIQQADFAISRAGASTLWELSANALPTLFIPFPHAAKNHQYFNAKKLSDAGMALVYTQKEMEIKNLDEILTHVDIESISRKLLTSIDKNAIKKIADIILKGSI
jgi:UDP-N-acetylglucosamine--N-acetylmuramyl-(pentapeptide) pyrophosphoryl-undecaprenol N-acetylglucosamine transferase